MARGFLGNFVYTGGYPHGHATFPVRRTCLFCSCFVQLALRAQTDTKHERQCAPHDGSLATVCGDSRGQRYGIENPKITYKKNCICEIIQNLKNIKQIDNTM